MSVKHSFVRDLTYFEQSFGLYFNTIKMLCCITVQFYEQSVDYGLLIRRVTYAAAEYGTLYMITRASEVHPCQSVLCQFLLKYGVGLCKQPSLDTSFPEEGNRLCKSTCLAILMDELLKTYCY